MSRKISLLLLIFNAAISQGQDYLYLMQKGGLPLSRWKEGDHIEIQLRNGQELNWFTATFDGGDSTGISFGTRFLSFEQIEGVRYPRGLMGFFANASYSAALFFSGITAVNNAINGQWWPLISTNQLILGSALVGVGVILDLFSHHEYKLEDPYYLNLIKTGE